jgi:hypothetical protein
MGFWRFRDAVCCIKYIAFARYPSMSDTSQDKELGGMLESRELRVLISKFWCIVM